MKPEIGERVTVVDVTFSGSRLLRGVVADIDLGSDAFHVNFAPAAVHSLYPEQFDDGGPPPNLWVFGLAPYVEGVGWCRGWEGENVQAMLVARGLE